MIGIPRLAALVEIEMLADTGTYSAALFLMPIPANAQTAGGATGSARTSQ
jgi:hypothetical protein